MLAHQHYTAATGADGRLYVSKAANLRQFSMDEEDLAVPTDRGAIVAPLKTVGGKRCVLMQLRSQNETFPGKFGLPGGHGKPLDASRPGEGKERKH